MQLAMKWLTCSETDYMFVVLNSLCFVRGLGYCDVYIVLCRFKGCSLIMRILEKYFACEMVGSKVRDNTVPSWICRLY